MTDSLQSDTSLDAIALLHGTDKSTNGHGYTAIYEHYLSGRRADSVSVLEIGIYKGASLQMWRDYFPSGHVVGIDKRPEAAQCAGDRIDVCIGDQANPRFLKEVGESKGSFDLVVDDGAHLAPAQKTSLLALWPYLRSGGLYVIEDLQTSYMSKYRMGWRHPETTVEFLKYLVDDIHGAFHRHDVVLPNMESLHFYDGLCVICRAP
jgi:hypothetical protein